MMIYNQYFSFKAILSLLIYGFLWIGIPLLGWGIDDLTKFFANPVRVIFLLASIYMSIVYAWFMPPNTLSDGVKDKLVNRQKVVLWLSIFLYAIMFTLLPYCERHNLLQIKADNSLKYVALVNLIIGVIISFWDPIHLGQQYSFNLTLQEGHKLVTERLFSYIRHPCYLVLIVWVLGVLLIYLSIVGLILTGVLTLLLAWRIYDKKITTARVLSTRNQLFSANEADNSPHLLHWSLD